MTTHRVNYDSLYALIDAAVAETPQSQFRSSRTNSGTWAGCDTFADAATLARKGWSVGRDESERIGETVRARVTDALPPANVAYHDVSGASVDIGEFLAGVPECMIDFRADEIRSPVVTILINGTVSAAVAAERIVKRGIAITALVEALAILQRSCVIYSEVTVTSGKDSVSILTNLKGASDALDIDAVMFGIAHPAMLRRLYFGAYENTAPAAMQDRIGYGYGRPATLTRTDEIGATVVIDPIASNTEINAMENDPAQWVLDTLRKIGALSNDD